MKIKQLVILSLAVAALLSACNPTAPTPEPRGEYPEFTLEAQKAAMQSIEEMRQKTRVKGLRDKLPPVDWIETAYHGLVVDANFDVIEMDFDTVSKMQESLFSILYEPTREKASQKYGDDLKSLFYDSTIQGKDQLVVRTAVLSALLAVSDPGYVAQYDWRHRIIRDGVDSLVGWSNYTLDPFVLERLQPIPSDWYLPPASSAYVESCRAEGVPIPPDWPDAGWISQGTLGFVFISTEHTAEVYTYKDPAVPGVCYALPRRDDSGSINLLGIICQSDTTGKACFWDNRTPDGAILTGVDLALDIDSISNGSTLRENCTECHRGYNVFNIHPGTALDLSRSTVIGGPYDTDPAVRFTPMGQPHWSNPGPLSLAPPPADQRSCTGCHQLPQMDSAYCWSVLQMAARTTMPPGGPPAGWPPIPPNPGNPLFADHILQMDSACP